MEGFVYMIVNTKNNRMYIGSTVDYEKRFRSHINGLRGGYHDNRKIQEDFEKFGEEAFKFTVLCETYSEDERFEIEESIIQRLKTFIHGYNLSVDGRGKYLVSEKTREKMRENTLGERNPFYGKKHTDGTRELLSKLASERYKGENNPFYGKTHSKETLERIAESFNKLKESGWVNPQKGVPKTPEAVHNNMMAQPKRREVHAEGRNYPSVSACARDLGVVNTTVRNRINNDNFPDYYYL